MKEDRKSKSAQKNAQKNAQKKRPLSADDVRDYLLLHPEFFDQNKDLLTILRPIRQKRAGHIVDFQAVLLERLQCEVASLSDAQGSLIHASRSNMTTQARIHTAVLCLLEARTFDHLCHMVCNDWIDILQVDCITICFEKNAETPRVINSNMRLLQKGVINGFLGHENAAILRSNVTAAEEIYGPATPLIKAEALIPIEKSPHNPSGILAFGSRDEGFFTAGQGTELLRFLAAAFHGQLKSLMADGRQ